MSSGRVVSQPPTREGLLVLEGIAAGYVPGVPLLRGVDLDVQKGEIVAVVSLDATGGKSTLVRVASGLMPPWRGSARFDGEDIYAMRFHDDQRYRRRCATVLEGGAMLVNLSVRDNVALPLRYHHRLRGRELTVKVDKLLEQAGFTEDGRAFPWQVSVRGRRLAAFARALAQDPQLVIIDRFFEGLEMPDWKRLFELVLELNHAEGTSWLLISELDPAIFQVAERVAVLEGGRVLDYGHRRQLYQDERVRAAFEAAGESAVRGARKTGRVVDPEQVESHDSDRILVIDSDEELQAFGSSRDLDTTQHGEPDRRGEPQNKDLLTTINIDGRVERAGLEATHAGHDPNEDTFDFLSPLPPLPSPPTRSEAERPPPPRPAPARPTPPPARRTPPKRPPVDDDLDGERTITIDGVIDLEPKPGEEAP